MNGGGGCKSKDKEKSEIIKARNDKNLMWNWAYWVKKYSTYIKGKNNQDFITFLMVP